ncbi:hypothetical protein [Xanthocytophaga agilis]|uniref:Uncharacterized protein n=1 Tax=Xanthocytophaga agilis TaxID=3048010 RepID=A0AAE3UGR8_9BACT|nr:hypothetical protein [Xanthocytophaga agilis]MDJ1505258.1 hypothetical protein [Xanthocytophaga agilis]
MQNIHIPDSSPITHTSVTEAPILSDQQKRDFCALLLSIYGIQIDPCNELLPVYYLAYSSSALAKDSIGKSIQSLSESVSRFDSQLSHQVKKIQTNSYVFSCAKDAFWFGFGKWGIPASLFIILTFVASAYVYIQNRNHKQAATIAMLLNRYGNIAVFDTLSGTAQIKQEPSPKGSVEYIELIPVKDFSSVKVGKNAVVDLKAKTIKIPLRFYPGVDTP